MKKSRIIIRLIVSLIITVIFFAGCGDDNGNGPTQNELIGTWEMTKITAEISGVSMTGTPEEADLHITLIINSDNTVESTKIQGGVTETGTGTWDTSEKKLILQGDDGATITDYTITGNILIISYWDEGTFYTLEFTKQ